jgi:hypothetical protein
MKSCKRVFILTLKTSVDVRYFPKSTMVVVLSAKRIEKMHCEALIGLKFRSARCHAEVNAPGFKHAKLMPRFKREEIIARRL